MCNPSSALSSLANKTAARKGLHLLTRCHSSGQRSPASCCAAEHLQRRHRELASASFAMQLDSAALDDASQCLRSALMLYAVVCGWLAKTCLTLVTEVVSCCSCSTSPLSMHLPQLQCFTSFGVVGGGVVKAIGPALYLSAGDAMRERNLLAAVVSAAHEAARQFGLVGHKALHTCKPPASFLEPICRPQWGKKGIGECATLLPCSKHIKAAEA